MIIIIWLTVLVIGVVLIYLYSKHETLLRNPCWPSTFYRHTNSINLTTLDKVLDSINYKQISESKMATLIIPSGYNYVEKELANIHTYPQNKLIFGIVGGDKLAAKDIMWSMLAKYYGHKHASQYMPNTYLNNDTDLARLVRSRTPSKKYILKKNIQRKEGIFLVSKFDDIFEKTKNKDFKIIQEYIRYPLLVAKHKLNLRVYVLIVINKNNFTAYCYNDGKCMYTKNPYSESSSKFADTITNYETSPEIYEKLPLTWKDLQKKLDSNIQIQPPKVLKLLGNICRPIERYVDRPLKFANKIMFQLFGADIIFKPEPVLLEFNKGPDMSFVSPKEQKLKMSVLQESLELNFTNFYKICC